jgi:hypothetical protein
MRLLAAYVLLSCGLFAADVKLGKPLALNQATSITQLNAAPEQFVGKDIQVRGKVTEVCQAMGCWTAISDPRSGEIVRIKVNDGEIVFPKSAVGKTAIAEGKFVKLELTKAQALARAKHEAEENGKDFQRPSKLSTVIYQIQGYGAVVTD